MATATKPTEADFHIAVICALTIEATEVERMFDEQYDHLSETVGKGNNTCNVNTGRIGHQNIVLLWMNWYGKTEATRASQTLRTVYENIRLCFVVGICGGVPRIIDAAGNEEEVVLGDVVISLEILKHDERKSYDNGFEITSPPVKLNPEVLSFMKPRLSGRRHDALKDHLHKIMQDSAAKRKGKVPQYPGIDKDHLYDSKYLHKHRADCYKCRDNGFCDDALKEHCMDLGCDTAKLVGRERLKASGPHRPAIQFGIVASGDTVMKSGKERDFIANMDKYGRRVVAFEMESAGICEDGLNVIVIKSVCDYADSHKRKDWQRYAAFVGAAAFRAFVEAWDSRKKGGLDKIVKKIQNIPQDVIHGVKIVTHGSETQNPSTTSPSQGSVEHEAENKNNVGADGSLAVPGRVQHCRGGSSTSLRAFFKKGGQDSPIATSPEHNLHRAKILLPKEDPTALPYAIPSQPTSQPPSQPPSQPYHQQPHQQLPCRPPLQPATQYRVPCSQTTPPPDDSNQFSTSNLPVYNPRTASQHSSQSAHLGGPPTPPHTPPQHHAARPSTQSSEGRSSSMTSVDRNDPLNKAHRRSSVASGITAASSFSVPRTSSNSNQGQGKRPVTEFPVFIAACENHNLITMKTFLERNTIDLISTASDGSSMLHLALGTSIVDDDEKQPIADAVALLCDYEADVDSKDRLGARPLHYCASTMNQKAAEVLLRYKANLKCTDAEGQTPLNYLAEDSRPDVELVKFFIRKRGKLGKNARMSSMPLKPTRQQQMVRHLLSVNNC